MPKEQFSSAAKAERLLGPTGAFLIGSVSDAQSFAMTEPSAFSMLNAIPQLWMLAPAANTARPELALAEDSEDVPTISEVMTWLSGEPKGDAEIAELREQILRQEQALSPQRHDDTPFFMQADPSAFQEFISADSTAHRLIEEANTTALTSAAWRHQMMLEEHLDRARMRRRFAATTARKPNPVLQVFATPGMSGKQQLRAICSMISRGLLQPTISPNPR